MKFRKKPIVIDAWKYQKGMDLPEGIEAYELPSGTGVPNCLKIVTLEGTMTCEEGDWIICGVKGEFYPCKPDIFEATYEPA